MSDPAAVCQEHTTRRLGALVRRLAIRVVDISAVGCLLESTQPIDAGTVALLALQIGGRRYVDPIRITRSVRLTGGIWTYRFGAEMLTLSPPGVATLRRVALLEGADLVVPGASRTTSPAGETAAEMSRTAVDAVRNGDQRSSD
jgi:hypothetical protein